MFIVSNFDFLILLYRANLLICCNGVFLQADGLDFESVKLQEGLVFTLSTWRWLRQFANMVPECNERAKVGNFLTFFFLLIQRDSSCRDT